MKYFLFFVILFVGINTQGQVILNADGQDNTYQLISSSLAPNYIPIETPDCSHSDFGNHIDEVFDDELNKYVFRFHIHVEHDNDRCIKFDRQRNEIKTYDQSPDQLLGIQEETVVYKWNFKLDEGFLASPNFTHLHQLKSVGGPYSSMPMYTLTARKGNPDRLELRYAETNKQITLLQEDLSPFIGTWLSVTERVTYGYEGKYSILIEKISDGSTLMTYTDNEMINWKEDTEFVRPKWGIYRSLINKQDLRDETLWFSDFSIEETSLLTHDTIRKEDTEIIVNSTMKQLDIQNLPKEATTITLFTLDGKKLITEKTASKTNLILNTTLLTNGIYVLSLKGAFTNFSKLIQIQNY